MRTWRLLHNLLARGEDEVALMLLASRLATDCRLFAARTGRAWDARWWLT